MKYSLINKTGEDKPWQLKVYNGDEIAVKDFETREEAVKHAFTQPTPEDVTCDVCGLQINVPAGACCTCPNCGATSGGCGV